MVTIDLDSTAMTIEPLPNNLQRQ